MARLQHVVNETGRAGKCDRRLGDVISRIGKNTFPEFPLLLTGAVRPDQHAVAARFSYCLHHQFVEIGQHVIALLRLGQQEGLQVVEHRIFSQIVPDDLRHVGVERLVICHAGAEGVRQRDVPRPVGIEQSGHAQNRVRAEGQGINEIVVHPAVNHVHAAQSRGGAHVDDVVMRHQVAPFHQLNSHLAGEIGVLEVGRVEYTGTEQHSRRLRPSFRGHGPQRAQQGLGIVLDGPHALQAKQIGENPLHDPAVGQHVGDAAGHAQIVFQHHELAAGQANQVRAYYRDVNVARHLQPAHLPPEVPAAVNNFAGHDAVGENAPLVIDVAQKEIQRRDALRQAAFDVVPLGAGDQARDQVIGKNPLCALSPTVNREGNALIQEGEVGGVLAPANFVRRKRGQHLQ